VLDKLSRLETVKVKAESRFQ